jgi:hypothetical protein
MLTKARMSLHVKDLIIYARNSEYIMEQAEQRMIALEQMRLGLWADLEMKSKRLGFSYYL